MKTFPSIPPCWRGRETIRETVLRIFIQNCMMSNFLKRACGKQFTRHAQPFPSIINLFRPTEIKTVRSTHSEIRRTKTAFNDDWRWLHDTMTSSMPSWCRQLQTTHVDYIRLAASSSRLSHVCDQHLMRHFDVVHSHIRTHPRVRKWTSTFQEQVWPGARPCTQWLFYSSSGNRTQFRRVLAALSTWIV